MEKAVSLSGQPVKRGTMAHEHDVYTMLADSAARQRDAAAVRQFASRAEELAVRDGHRYYLPIVHRAWGVARRLESEYVEAEAQLHLALEAFQQMGTRWQAGRTLVELGELAVARSNVDAGRGYFSRALSEFEAMKAVPDLEHTRMALDALG